MKACDEDTKMRRTAFFLFGLILMLSITTFASSADDGWIPAEDFSIHEETIRMISDALNGLAGVEYVPVANLGEKQGEDGIHHAVLCQARVVVPGAKPKFVVIYVREYASGERELIKIVDFDIGLFAPEENRKP